MEPIQILELIKEDIRDKFDGDPLMMRTMNLVITEYKARSERLHKHGVMQAEGSDGAKGAAVGNGAAGQNVSVDKQNEIDKRNQIIQDSIDIDSWSA